MALLRTYCVTHEAPAFSASLVDLVVGVWDLPASYGVHVSAIDEYWGRMRHYSHTSAGTYVIPALIDNGRPAELTGILSHRKFIARASVDQPAQYSIAGLGATDAERVPRLAIEPWPGFEFLVPCPVDIEVGVVEQYINAHYAIDLFDYLSLAAELQVISATEANEIAQAKRLIPGGCEVGTYPTAWIRSTLQRLSLLGREFLTRHGPRLQARDGFQIRAVDFLSERLGSYLLLSALNDRYPDGIPREIWGQCYQVVSPAGAG